MASKSLIKKIEALTPEQQAEVERFVDSLLTHPRKDGGAPGLVERLRLHRERLAGARGVVDSLPLIRGLRENGS